VVVTMKRNPSAAGSGEPGPLAAERAIPAAKVKATAAKKVNKGVLFTIRLPGSG